MWPFKKKPLERREHEAVDFFLMHEKQWDWFVKTCEKFDYIKIKDGCATGYMANELPEVLPKINEGDYQEVRRRLFMGGTGILIPYLVCRPSFYVS
jgi:hypothetical protein